MTDTPNSELAAALERLADGQDDPLGRLLTEAAGRIRLLSDAVRRLGLTEARHAATYERVAGVLLTQMVVDGCSRTTGELLDLLRWMDELEVADA
jgi:hypothetical protein